MNYYSRQYAGHCDRCDQPGRGRVLVIVVTVTSPMSPQYGEQP
jgi:hypothetical protein